MNKVFDIIKGSFIGLANVIPGVSGGTMAVIFKIYDKLISAIADFPKHPIKAIRDLFFILIGVILGVVIGVFVISYGYEKVPFITTFLFVGFIIGGLKPIYKEVEHRFYKMPNIIGFIISIAVIVILPLLTSKGGIQSGILYYIMLFIVGIITAVTMIIPGVSGSMVLLIIGYYAHVLDLAKDFFKAIISFDVPAVFELIVPVALLGIGFLVGAVLFSKATKWVIIHYANMFFAIVFGLVVSSPYAIIYLLNESNPILKTNPIEIIVGLPLMIGAAYLAYVIIVKSENKKSKAS